MQKSSVFFIYSVILLFAALANAAQIDFNPPQPNKSAANKTISAIDFLQQNKNKYQLESNFENLKLYKVKSSLLARHYYFQQYLNDVKVDKAEIIVSIANDNKILKVFNNTSPVSNITNATPEITSKAVDSQNSLAKAWDFLQVSGELRSQPETQLIYLPVGDEFKLAYKVNLSVSDPMGDWEFYIDAVTQTIIKVQRIDLPLFKNANADAKNGVWRPFAKSANFKNLSDALVQLNKKQAKQKQSSSSFINKADATALVFDPDPRTTLNDASLEDNSPDADFDPAYLSRTLREVELEDGVYSLNGPWVSIVDREPPDSAPTTSETGNWNGKRGEQSFNDVMTYFHIDQNQRYIQSLGFTGSKGIQMNSIEADANGGNGADQSFYSPLGNWLSFGQGCVDDNEDADVILHEYGHAIIFSINPHFFGGDTGAMGEGFGDYWAVSYSLKTANGLSFQPDWVFSWDGHNACWAGRRTDRTSYRYDPTKNYGAHEITNGQNADELWSTPLVQSLRDLLNQGVDHADVDQIILEAQFGLGSNLTMRQMAQSIVETAKNLFPNGQHESVFTQHFTDMNILAAQNNSSGSGNNNSSNSNDRGSSGGSINLFMLMLFFYLAICRFKLTREEVRL